MNAAELLKGITDPIPTYEILSLRQLRDMVEACERDSLTLYGVVEEWATVTLESHLDPSPEYVVEGRYQVSGTPTIAAAPQLAAENVRLRTALDDALAVFPRTNADDEAHYRRLRALLNPSPAAVAP